MATMTTMDKLRLMKASQAADAVDEIVEAEEPIVIEDPGTTPIPKGKKKVKVNSSAGDITVSLPTTDVSEFDVVTITKTDNTTNTVTVTGLVGNDYVLTYQYQTVIATYNGTAWEITGQQLPPTETTPQIHVGTTAPSDTKLLWLDINE